MTHSEQHKQVLELVRKYWFPCEDSFVTISGDAFRLGANRRASGQLRRALEEHGYIENDWEDWDRGWLFEYKFQPKLP